MEFALGNCSSVTSLNMAGNPIGNVEALCSMLRVNTTLKTLNLFDCKMGRENESLVVEAVKENTGLTSLNLRGDFLLAEDIRTGGLSSTVDIKFLPGTVAGTDAGSGGKYDLKYYQPEVPEGFLLMGHGGEPDGLLVAKGTKVKACDGWTKVWTDAGSGKKLNYAIWLPTSTDPDYVALGVFMAFQTKTVQEPNFRGGMVHKSVCEPAQLGRAVWNDRGTGARADVTVNGVKWGAQGVINVMMPSVCSMYGAPPPCYAIKEEL